MNKDRSDKEIQEGFYTNCKVGGLNEIQSCPAGWTRDGFFQGVKWADNNPTDYVLNKAIDLYLFKFRLLPSEEQNKYVAAEWIKKNWHNYEDKYPYSKI